MLFYFEVFMRKVHPNNPSEKQRGKALFWEKFEFLLGLVFFLFFQNYDEWNLKRLIGGQDSWHSFLNQNNFFQQKSFLPLWSRNILCKLYRFAIHKGCRWNRNMYFFNAKNIKWMRVQYLEYEDWITEMLPVFNWKINNIEFHPPSFEILYFILFSFF